MTMRFLGGTTLRRLIATLAMVAAVACSSAAQAHAQTGGQVPRDFFGVIAVLPTSDDFEAIEKAGIGAYRIQINWRSIQTERGGRFNWTHIDREFQLAIAAGLRPEPVLYGTPNFVSADGSKVIPPVRTAADREAWREFVAAAVARYRPGGSFWFLQLGLDQSLAPTQWLIWNEQNARAFWFPKANPAEYASLLALSQAAIDSVAPGDRIAIGGMYEFPVHKKSLKASKYLRKLLRFQAASNAIDAVSVHPYSRNVKGLMKQMKKTRKILDKKGHAATPLIAGEVGWASSGPKKSEFVKSPEKQAQLLSRAFNRLLAARGALNLQAAYWYAWRDFNIKSPCIWCPGAGLVEINGKPKPALGVYSKLIADRVAGGG